MLPLSTKTPYLNRICLRARDPGRSAEFYRTVFGITSVQNTTNAGGYALSVPRTPNTAAGFEVIFAEGLPPGDHLTGLDHISFEVPSRESVDNIYDEAKKSQARATQPRLYEGRWQTFIFDPDGYKVEVYSSVQNEAVRSSGDQA